MTIIHMWSIILIWPESGQYQREKGWCHNECCGNQRTSQYVNGPGKGDLYSKSSYCIVRVSTFLSARCSPVHKARLYRSKLQLPNQWTYMVVLWQRTYIPFVSTCIRCHHQFRLGNYGLASLSYSFNFLPCQVFRYPLCNIFVRRWHNRFLCRKEQSIRRSLCCQTAIQKIL